ncbi:unnamed protein product [Ranitomeya imitator]|uniref:Helix-turn-helix domain-containing protein n=1 Tax=Ranitomeya imitator TaxID=111125 RepID=A0ABN9LVV7_9NEOB|nr:unnamed protein product [Ranitomeya imitator]
MDYRAREQAWLKQSDQVFGISGVDTQQVTDHSWDDKLSQMKSALLKRSKLWWNRLFLEKYATNNMIPRGLRVRVIPTFPVEDEQFISKWEEACDACSKIFLQLLISQNTGHITELDKTIDGIQAEIRKGCPPDRIEPFESELNKTMDQVVKRIQDNQVSKYNRDLKDYQTKRVYLWRNNNNIRRVPSNTSISSLSGQSEGSVSSATSYGTSDTHRLRDHAYHPYKRRPWSQSGANGRDNKVINLSSHVLSEVDVAVLGRGLSFSPTPGFDTFTAVKDLHIFARSLLFKRHFFNEEFHRLFPTEEEQEAVRILEELALEHENTGGKVPQCIRPRSTKFPPFGSCPSIDLFVRVVTNEFLNIPKYGGGDNLTKEERIRLRYLQNLPDVVLKPADKGGNVVVWPKAVYEREAFRQLNNTVCYKKLTYNPLSAFSAKLESILKKALHNDIVTKDLVSALTVREPTIPTLYLLPKVHKDIRSPPGRPIVSGRGNFLEQVNKWIDYHLQPLVQLLPSFLKDTGDLLRKVDGLCLEGDTLLASVDVESLYTNIRHSDGLRAVQFFLSTSTLAVSLRDLILELLEFTLTHNFFVFKGSFYLQLQGTAMGAAFAPSYANLFLGLWERDLFLSDKQGSIDRVLFWTRYIDDIFFVWQGTAVDLAQFISSLNSNDQNIRLTPVWDAEKIDFLDVTIYKDGAGLIQTDIYRKQTATNTLLHASSCHPRHMVQAIPVGQFLRLRRICSNDADFEARAEELKQRFLSRGYSGRCVKRAYHRAKYSDRNNLLYGKTSKKSTNNNAARFITSYNPQHGRLRTAIMNAWPILKADPILVKFLPNNPSITFRRATNLRDQLTRSHYMGQGMPTFLDVARSGGGCAPCGRCVACPNVDKCTSFTNSDGTKQFTIRQRITCVSRYVIYYATCPCGLIYIGLTTRQLKVRIREHILGIIAAASCADASTLKTIPRHFWESHQCNEKLLRVRGIDLLRINIRGGNLSKRLAQLESKWIWTLRTIHPHGLNDISFAPFL